MSKPKVVPLRQPVVGKRYWFRTENIVYSGTATEERDPKSGYCVGIRRDNGDIWFVDPTGLFESEEDLYKSCHNMHHLHSRD